MKTLDGDVDFIGKAVKNHLESEIRKAAEQELLEAQNRLKARLPEIISTVMLAVYSNLSMERFEYGIAIKAVIRKEDNSDDGKRAQG